MAGFEKRTSARMGNKDIIFGDTSTVQYLLKCRVTESQYQSKASGIP